MWEVREVFLVKDGFAGHVPSLWFSLPLPGGGRTRAGPYSPSWTLIFEKGNKKGVRRCYNFHFVIVGKPWYIHYLLTADVMLSNSTAIAGWQLYHWWLFFFFVTQANSNEVINLYVSKKILSLPAVLYFIAIGLTLWEECLLSITLQLEAKRKLNIAFLLLKKKQTRIVSPNLYFC